MTRVHDHHFLRSSWPVGKLGMHLQTSMKYPPDLNSVLSTASTVVETHPCNMEDLEGRGWSGDYQRRLGYAGVWGSARALFRPRYFSVHYHSSIAGCMLPATYCLLL